MKRTNKSGYFTMIFFGKSTILTAYSLKHQKGMVAIKSLSVRETTLI